MASSSCNIDRSQSLHDRINVKISSADNTNAELPLSKALKIRPFKDWFEELEINTQTDDEYEIQSHFAKPFPLPSVATGELLNKICDWLRQTPLSSRSSDFIDSDDMDSTTLKSDVVLTDYDKEWVDVPHDMFCELVTASDYLGIDGMFDVLGTSFAQQVMGKTPEEIRTQFGIPNDLTEEQLKKIETDFSWFDKTYRQDCDSTKSEKNEE